MVRFTNMWTLPDKSANIYGENAELKQGSVLMWTCCSCQVTHSEFNAPLSCPNCAHKKDEGCQKSVRQVEWWAPTASFVEQYGPPREPPALIARALPPPLPVPSSDEPSRQYRMTQQIFDLSRFEIEHKPKTNPDLGPNTILFNRTPDDHAAQVIRENRLHRIEDMIKDEEYHYKEIKFDDVSMIGWNPEELIKCGVIEEKNVKPNDLTGDIHPLFAYDHWIDTPKEVYDAWAPAMRLATKFITEPFAMKYWTTLLFGKREQITFNEMYGLGRQAIEDWVDVTPEKFIYASDYLDNLGRNHNLITFRFSEENRRREEGQEYESEGIFATTQHHYMHEYLKWKVKPEDLRPRSVGVSPYRRCPITLDSDFYVIALRLLRIKYNEPNLVLRQYFDFAVTLTHEVCC